MKTIDGPEVFVVVGGVVEQDGKYLLVQEAQKRCYGKWSIPAGQLDAGETSIDGMKREVYEESGFIVEPTGICQIGNRQDPNRIFISIIFTARIKSGEIKFDTEEILDARWFAYEEIIAMKDNVRNAPLVIGAIDNARSGIIAPLEIINNYDK